METQLSIINAGNVATAIHATGHGALILTLHGRADVRVNFDVWQLAPKSVIIIFPGDVVDWKNLSSDFSARILRYSSDLLRSASLNIEHTVYDRLREDRVCSNRKIVDEVITPVFGILGFYYSNPVFENVDTIARLQLQALFEGFHDYVHAYYNKVDDNKKTSRARQLFAVFMQQLESHYRESREVSFYSSRMNISRKYLGNITRLHTGMSPKAIIDEYVMLQLRLRLRDPQRNIKQIASEFHFAGQSALTHYFQSHEGINPKDYRVRE